MEEFLQVEKVVHPIYLEVLAWKVYICGNVHSKLGGAFLFHSGVITSHSETTIIGKLYALLDTAPHCFLFRQDFCNIEKYQDPSILRIFAVVAASGA